MGPTAFLFVVSVLVRCASGSFPKAQNVTWKSTNFKTLLSWHPEPSPEYSYTVEFSAIGQDKQNSPHCVLSSETFCDLTSYLTDVKACYTADVLSVPPRGVTTDLTEFPHSSSERFCPYKDTEIGRLDFELIRNEDKTSTTLQVTDSLTAVFRDGRQLSIRDIFSDQLQYKVTYWRNQSTGKKVLQSKDRNITLTDLDRGESYCFFVQALIADRSLDKQLGEVSQTKCSKNDKPSIFQVFSLGVIAAGVLLMLLLVGTVVAIVLVCYRHRKRALRRQKGLPLREI
ncbi:coagulation factor IIIa [Oryzias melastigma]|uniref:Tissue factor n=1 Tax=Oryzias melastigma TaxID=30732 RepID=A0A3B3B559_ORYME|nr:coagulation factor IIIa [Oryzias melastigma]